MGKRLFLLFVSCLMGVVMLPQSFCASDTLAATGAEYERAKKIQPVSLERVAVASTYEAGYTANYARAVYAQEETGYGGATYAPSNVISYLGRSVEIIEVADTTTDSVGHVNKYGNKFLYGHNSAGVFGGLTAMGVGSGFAVTLGGKTMNYRVAKVVVYEKNAGMLQLNGAGNYMRAVANAKNDGVQYDMALMTCYGTMYGNGDASHRLVIFANRA